MAAVSLSPLPEYCYYLVLSSNIHPKGDKTKRENNDSAAIREYLVLTFGPTKETETLHTCIALGKSQLN